MLKNSANVANVKRVIGDGAYDSNSNFLRASRMGVDALIRVRKNSSLKSRKCNPRRLAVLEQLGK
ncbi:transposase [Candidatus Bathyarchaeota archaeon A05DMB-2]|nr:transposase [Candidatus Bathyarchaeota archaeon A05DMB-2]